MCVLAPLEWVGVLHRCGEEKGAGDTRGKGNGVLYDSVVLYWCVVVGGLT